MRKTELVVLGETIHPKTKASIVSHEHTNIEDALDQQNRVSSTITQSTSISQVGLGDGEDLSFCVEDGFYESATFYGKTLVNCIRESSRQDVVLPYEFEDGQYVTINDTKESGALGVKLKGQTLVNLTNKSTYKFTCHQSETSKYTSVSDVNKVLITINGKATEWRYSLISFKKSMLKPNTKYLVKFDGYFKGTVTIKNGDSTGILTNTVSVEDGCNYVIITTNDLSATINNQGVFFYPREPQSYPHTYEIANVRLIEYQEGMEDWDIPYFEGMASCKMPTVHTVGKNLFDGNLEKGSLDIDTGKPSADNSYNRTVNFIRIYPNKEYRLRANGTVNGRVFYYDENKVYISTQLNENRLTNIPSNAKYLKFRIGVDVLSNGQEIQLEESSAPTTYEPHRSSILSLPEEVVLRSLPNGVCDTFNTRTGVYTQMVQEFVFDGSDDEGWALTNSSTSHETMIAFEVKDRDYMNKLNKHSNQPLLNDLFRVYTDKSWNYFDDEHFRQWGNGSSISWVCVIPRSKLSSVTVEGFKSWLSKNPMKVVAKLKTPIITKINLPSTLKSWNTTTHIYSEIPENTLYPTLTHSNPTYPVILKPSTKYSIVANSYSNSHTNSAINFNLGGATASTTVGNRVTTITTPSTLSNELLTMSGRGNKLNHVMVIEGEVVGDEPYFEGICDCKSPTLSNVGKNLFNIDGKFAKGAYSYGIPVLNNSNQVIEKIGENSLHITCGTDYYHSGWGQIIDVKNLDSVTISVTSAFSSSLTKPELKVLCLYESEEVPVAMDGQKKTDYDYRHLTQVLNDTNKTYTRTINTRGFAKVYVLFTGGYKAGGKGTFDFTLHNIYVGEESANHDYEPYKSNTTTFEQKDGKMIVLRSLPNGVCDTLNVETGEYVQRIGEVMFDGSENWDSHSNNSTYTSSKIFALKNNLGTNTESNCDKFAATNGSIAMQDGLERIKHTATHTYINITNNRYGGGGSKDFKTWLSQNPVTVQYELATPIVSTIDVQGFPYAYTNGHVQLSSGHSGQSLTPKVEYVVQTNRAGAIQANQDRLLNHDKRLAMLEDLVLHQLIQLEYNRAKCTFLSQTRQIFEGGIQMYHTKYELLSEFIEKKLYRSLEEVFEMLDVYFMLGDITDGEYDALYEALMPSAEEIFEVEETFDQEDVEV